MAILASGRKKNPLEPRVALANLPKLAPQARRPSPSLT